jgi:hypothetical protein
MYMCPELSLWPICNSTHALYCSHGIHSSLGPYFIIVVQLGSRPPCWLMVARDLVVVLAWLIVNSNATSGGWTPRLMQYTGPPCLSVNIDQMPWFMWYIMYTAFTVQAQWSQIPPVKYSGCIVTVVRLTVMANGCHQCIPMSPYMRPHCYSNIR